MWLELILGYLLENYNRVPKKSEHFSTFRQHLTKTLNVKKRLGNENKNAVICQAIQTAFVDTSTMTVFYQCCDHVHGW